jgi:hypothetical protein
LNEHEIQKYDQVAWVDSDIVINVDNSPNICSGVPIDAIGGVDVYSAFSSEAYAAYLARIYNHWEKRHIKFIDNSTPEKYYTNYGFSSGFDKVVQTGVMVVSPRHHNDLFLRVYNEYEDKGGKEWNYEMRPLSYEILLNGKVFWLDYRYNVSWLFYKTYFYPFLMCDSKYKYFNIIKTLLRTSLASKCINVAFDNSYFLHFGGISRDIECIKYGKR